jgi:3-oxoacyl-[acyl-carrier-protein] synthase-3
MSTYVKKELGADRAMNYEVTNACAGMMTGVYLLTNMITAGIVRNGMVISGESISLIAESATKEIKDITDAQLASLTVGDSGAACIIDRAKNNEEGIDFIDFVNYAKFADLCTGLPSKKSGAPVMYTNAKEIHKANIKRVPYVIEKIFNKNGKVFNAADYDFMITHQTAVKAIQLLAKTCGRHFKVNMPKELYSVDEYGNTATTSHFVVLYNKIKEGIIKPGARVLMVINASGIVIGCISITIGCSNSL